MMTHEPIRKALEPDDHVSRLRKMMSLFAAQASQNNQTQFYQDIQALLADLDRANAEAQEQARLNGMGSEREAALLALVERVTRERDQLKQQLALLRNPNRAAKMGQGSLGDVGV